MSYFTEKTLKFSLYGGMIPIVTTTVKKIAQTIFFTSVQIIGKEVRNFGRTFTAVSDRSHLV